MNNFDKYDEYANITKEITDKYIMLKNGKNGHLIVLNAV